MKLAVIGAYDLPGDPGEFRIERCPQCDGSVKWAVRRYGQLCLNKEAEFDYEPLPSNRDDDFLQRCRFDTPEEAYAKWEEYIVLRGDIHPGLKA